MKITLERFTFGYYRVMEFFAWSLAIRLVLAFSDYRAVPLMFAIIAGLELFRIWMEKRDIKTAIAANQDLSNLDNALKLLSRFDACKNLEHKMQRSTECYYCIVETVKDNIRGSIEKKEEQSK